MSPHTATGNTPYWERMDERARRDWAIDDRRRFLNDLQPARHLAIGLTSASIGLGLILAIAFGVAAALPESPTPAPTPSQATR